MRYTIILYCAVMIIRNDYAVKVYPQHREKAESVSVQLQVGIRPIWTPAIRFAE
jgi:hypothetical protein